MKWSVASALACLLILWFATGANASDLDEWQTLRQLGYTTLKSKNLDTAGAFFLQELQVAQQIPHNGLLILTSYFDLAAIAKEKAVYHLNVLQGTILMVQLIGLVAVIACLLALRADAFYDIRNEEDLWRVRMFALFGAALWAFGSIGTVSLSTAQLVFGLDLEPARLLELCAGAPLLLLALAALARKLPLSKERNTHHSWLGPRVVLIWGAKLTIFMFLVATACATNPGVRNFMHIGLAYDEAARSAEILNHRLLSSPYNPLPAPELNSTKDIPQGVKLLRSLNLPTSDYLNHWWQVTDLLSHAEHSFSTQTKCALLSKLDNCPQLSWPNKFRFARAGCVRPSSSNSQLAPALAASAATILGLVVCIPEGIAWIFCAQGKLISAEQIFSRCLRYKGWLRGNNHPELAAQHLTFARVLKKSGFLANARAHAETALCQLTEYFGPNHTRALQAQHVLGTIHLEDGQLAESERCFKIALAGPAASWSTAPYCNLLLDTSKLYIKRGNIVPAKELCHEAVNLSQAEYNRLSALKSATFGLAGETYRSGALLCESLDALASVYLSIGRDRDAVEVLERLLAQKKRTGTSSSSRQTAEKLFGLYTHLGCIENARAADLERNRMSAGEKIDRAVYNFMQRLTGNRLSGLVSEP